MKSIYLIIFGLLLLWTNPASASKTCKCVCEDQNRITNLIDITISEEYTLSEEVHNSITIQPEPQPESQPAPQPAPQPESDFDECQRLFQYEAVTAHNNYRKMHHVSPLNSNTELQKIAFNYANYLASNDVFQHSKATGLGENLAFVWSSQVKTLNDCSGYGNRFSKMWYDEVGKYDFGNSRFSAETGHFTQVVWKDTTDVGCGISISSSGRIYGVCNYTPQGNFKGEFGKNVFPI